ncbi:MCE family protein [Pseudodesulfovibrio sp. JC047]|uniref:MlaD family protein n=1 Tax=Pseudodesulfovibrio sp. JC047 TaxID=2683199 RepID=UPI0013D1036E|nr:MlaD family protein [Pseudodesulfovibrio sp. JC047]NDV17913.1 MCE family protein [Pseudodesulfovibrio sp. JC047]
MTRKREYFKLGLFIIIGISMLVAMVIILGAGRYFQTTYAMETYFDESINGLAVGSPVKLRGVNIGRVASINFVSNKYEDANLDDVRYVYVECEINPDLFDSISEEKFIELLRKDVKRGLRIRPTSLGLTGQLFLNIIYDDPKSNPPLPIQWTPQHAYIPSAPSTLSRVEGAIATISKTLSSLKKEDLESIIKDVKSIVDSIDKFMKTDSGREAGKKMLGILESTRSILDRTNTLMADPALDTILPNVAGTVEGANRILAESADDIIAAAHEAKIAIASFKEVSDTLNKTLNDPGMSTAMEEIAPTLNNISQASADLTAAVAKVHVLVNRLNGVVASEETNIHAIITDTREIMQNVKELTGDAKRYPSGMIFGTPPSKSNPQDQ